MTGITRRPSLLSLLLLATTSVAPLHAQTTAPTASESPEAIADQWIKASSKYDAKRSEILAEVDREGHEGAFRPDWGSLSKFEVPEWYKDAKFGIFIHWGVYSVPSFGSEWYPREMYLKGSEINKHHVEKYGPLTQFGYKDFIPMFKAEHYDPQVWAKLFKDAGANYVVPVFEHHDGFTMYDSGLSDWTAKKMGPKRDLVGELAVAVRAQGMHLGASSHRIEHDWFMDGGREQPSDVNDPKYAALYGPAEMQVKNSPTSGDEVLEDDWTYVSPKYAEDWVARSAEIVQKYHPDIMYYDWWIGQASIRPYLAKFAAYYYNESTKHGQQGLINFKYKAMEDHSGVLDLERGQLSEIHPTYWQTDTSVSNKSWGYIENDTFKTPDFIVHQLVDIVSKNGNLLLNIGPRPDGTIPQEVQQVLLAVGAWLKINGDAVYGTRPYKIYGEGPTKVKPGAFHDTDTLNYIAEDFRFTTKGNNLYAIEYEWPSDEEAVIKTLATGSAVDSRKVTSVQLLGSDEKLGFTQAEDGLHIHLPDKPSDQPAYTFRISF